MPSRKNRKAGTKRGGAARSPVVTRKKRGTRGAVANRKSSTSRKKRGVRGVPVLVDVVSFEPRGLGPCTGGQAGDLQGVSGVAAAASESVEELLEEGNAFEADVVQGVEDAENADEAEVETHEVPEDDVPNEYLDQR